MNEEKEKVIRKLKREFEDEHDWLYQEMMLEAHHTPWDLDEGKRIRQEHEAVHAKIHSSQRPLGNRMGLAIVGWVFIIWFSLFILFLLLF